MKNYYNPILDLNIEILPHGYGSVATLKKEVAPSSICYKTNERFTTGSYFAEWYIVPLNEYVVLSY